MFETREREREITHAYEYMPKKEMNELEYEEKPELKKVMPAVKARGADYIHVICTDTQEVFSLRVGLSDEVISILEGTTIKPLKANIQIPQQIQYSMELHGAIPETMPFSGVKVSKARAMNAMVYGATILETVLPVFTTRDVFLDILNQIQNQINNGDDELNLDFYRLTRLKMMSPEYKDMENNNYLGIPEFSDSENYNNLKK